MKSKVEKIKSLNTRQLEDAINSLNTLIDMGLGVSNLDAILCILLDEKHKRDQTIQARCDARNRIHIKDRLKGI